MDVIFNIRARDSGETAAATFASRRGNVTTELWRHALYGFGGRIPFGRIIAFVKSRMNILLVEKEAECHANVAYAAQQVGARPYVWSTPARAAQLKVYALPWGA
jgi:hypothetical protein